jgi:hypothetical protein
MVSHGSVPWLRQKGSLKHWHDSVDAAIFCSKHDPGIIVSVCHCYHLHFQGACVSGYGILSHVTLYFSFGWFEIFPYLSFGGYNKERFWHLVAVCRTTSLRPFFVDSAEANTCTTVILVLQVLIWKERAGLSLWNWTSYYGTETVSFQWAHLSWLFPFSWRWR